MMEVINEGLFRVIQFNSKSLELSLKGSKVVLMLKELPISTLYSKAVV
jgi:hypothetical protein